MAMAMASVGHKNKSLPDGTFVMGGRSYHRIGSLLPSSGQDSNFAQIYLLDTLDATSRRSSIFGNRLDERVLSDLHDQLRMHNRLISQFCQAATSNVPELIWSSEDDILNMQIGAIVSQPGLQRLVVIRRHSEDDRLEFIPDSHSLYHALSYPLLFPVGNHGWHTGMQRRDPQSGNLVNV
jgi:hypothetical protein